MPGAEMLPFLMAALEKARAVPTSFMLRDVIRIADAAIRETGDPRAIHVQNARVTLHKQPGVYRRQANAAEHPGGTVAGPVWLYSLDNPPPPRDLAVSRDLERTLPDPRQVPVSGRRRSRSRPKPELAPEPEPLDERAELIVTLVRELVRDTDFRDSVKIRTLTTQLAKAQEEVERLSTELTKLKRNMKAVARAQKLLDSIDDSA